MSSSKELALANTGVAWLSKQSRIPNLIKRPSKIIDVTNSHISWLFPLPMVVSGQTPRLGSASQKT
jgi:hypothetical protein